MDIHKRLKQARKNRGFAKAKEAADGFGWTYSTYAGHENGTRGIKIDEILRYSKAFFVSPAWLAFGENAPPNTTPTATIKITRWVQAGYAPKKNAWPKEDWREVCIPIDYKGTLYGAEIKGTSMDKIYKPGSFIIYNDIEETGEELRDGERYVFERTSHLGEWECAVKTLRSGIKCDSRWLTFESNDTETLHTQFPLNSPDHVLKIIGRVVFSFNYG